MHSARSPRSTYLAAFLLGALIALLLSPRSRAAEPGEVDRGAMPAAGRGGA